MLLHLLSCYICHLVVTFAILLLHLPLLLACCVIVEEEEPRPDYSDEEEDNQEEEDYAELRKSVKPKLKSLLSYDEWTQILAAAGTTSAININTSAITRVYG